MMDIWRNLRSAMAGDSYNWLDLIVVGGALLVGVLWTVASKEHFRGSLMQLTLGVVILAYAVIRNHLKKRSQPKRKPLEQLQDWRGRDDL